MSDDSDRVSRIRDTLQDGDLDALICTLPTNVLMVSGYWPVVGTALAIATRDGRICILAPEDERDLTEGAWATEVRTYSPGSLDGLTGPSESIRPPFLSLLSELELLHARLGVDQGPAYQESTYAASFQFGAGIVLLLELTAPGAEIVPAESVISQLRSSLTLFEVDRVRLACRIAGEAFRAGARDLVPGLREPEVATSFASPMQRQSLAVDGVKRAGAFTWCMSGENSALAGAAYARTRNRELQPGDFALVHCNSYLDGYWTDITRTFCLGKADDRKHSIYDAIFAARTAALGAIRPGVRAADVDRAARQVLTERGFGAYFTHGIGHNVGFSAISAEFPPRLHPASPDILETGMTFNIEPAIYIKGFGGVRHCDVVTVLDGGPEVLTSFQSDEEQLIVT